MVGLACYDVRILGMQSPFDCVVGNFLILRDNYL